MTGLFFIAYAASLADPSRIRVDEGEFDERELAEEMAALRYPSGGYYIVEATDEADALRRVAAVS